MSSTNMRQEIFELHNKMDDQALYLKQLVHDSWRACYITNFFIVMDLIRGVRGRRVSGSIQTKNLAGVMKSRNEAVSKYQLNPCYMQWLINLISGDKHIPSSRKYIFSV